MHKSTQCGGAGSYGSTETLTTSSLLLKTHIQYISNQHRFERFEKEGHRMTTLS